MKIIEANIFPTAQTKSRPTESLRNTLKNFKSVVCVVSILDVFSQKNLANIVSNLEWIL